MTVGWIRPDWPAPANVVAWVTTRQGGVSAAPWDSFNVGMHVGDRASDVRDNRARLRQQLPAGLRLQWLHQVHGTRVAVIDPAATSLRRRTADATTIAGPDQAAVVMTADCLPVLFCDRAGTRVAAAHAGWRGLLDGVLEQTVAALDRPAGELMAWLGPAIAVCHFQVGDEVREAFLQHPLVGAAGDASFTPCPEAPGKWMMDIYQLARLRLRQAGLDDIHGGGLCTVCDRERFFSYRRDGVTGRMASLIYLKA